MFHLSLAAVHRPLRHLWLALVVLVQPWGLGPANAASFDCTRARAPVERLVCASRPVSDADEALAKAYVHALADAAAPGDLRASQRAWIREVRDRCANEACLLEAYHRRLEGLTKAGPASAVTVVGQTPALAPAASVTANAVESRPPERSSAPVEEPVESPRIVSSSADAVELEVTGSGPTAEAARMDGIRQALQRVVPQVIAVDRKIENDAFLMDRIMSSMTGHVQHITVLGTSRVADGYLARLRLQISRREIANFVQFRASGTSVVSGGALLSEAAREVEARSFRERFLARFFKGYPSRAILARVTSIKPDRSDPTLVDLTIEYRLDPGFIAQIRAAAGEVRCEAGDWSCYSGHTSVLCFASDGSRHCIRLARGPENNYPTLERAIIEICRGGCQGYLGFVLRFTDEDGRRVGKGACYDLVADSDGRGSSPIRYYPEAIPVAPARVVVEVIGGQQVAMSELSDTVQTYQVKLSLTKLSSVADMGLAKAVQVAAVIRGRPSGWDSPPIFDISSEAAATDRSALRKQVPCDWPD